MSTEIKIERFAYGGEGVGTLESGKIVFVPGAIPEETVRVEIQEEQKSWARARLLEILDPSDARVDPACPYAAECGGCEFQTVELSREWDLKTGAVIDTLERIGKLTVPADPERVGPGEPERYRRRVRFQIGPDGRCGFFKPSSHDLVYPVDCIVTHPDLLLARDAIDGYLHAFTGGTLLLELSDDGVVGCLQVEGDDVDLLALSHPLRPFVHEARKGDNPLNGLRLMPARPQAVKDVVDIGDVRVTLTVDGTARRIPVGLFNQANPAMNDALVDVVLRQLAPAPGDDVLELYCGWGNFSLPILERGASLQGMELSVGAIDTASRLASKDPAITAPHRFNMRNLHRGLPNKHKEPGRYGKVLLDPPRTGARAVIDDVAALQPQRVVYVSCDAPTFARDARRLLAKAPHLSFTHLALIDMFPRTHHVEVVGTFEAAPPHP